MNLFGRVIKINDELIDEVTCMSMEGIKFYRDRKISDVVVKKFP